MWIGARQFVLRILLAAHDASVQVKTYLLPHQVARVLREEATGDKMYRLKDNVLNSVQLHSSARFNFLTDQDCLRLIDAYYTDDDDASFMRQIYLKEEGRIKGDICRGLALYDHGGLYMDVDLQCRMSVWSLIAPSTTFVTILEHGSRNFFQAFIGATPRHPILKRYLDLFLVFYRGKLEMDVNEKKGVVLLRLAYDQILAEHPNNVEVQVWDEQVYDVEKFPSVEPPGGAEALCQYLVVAEEEQVPFWSHSAGSSSQCRVRR